MKIGDTIYLDYQASTPVDPRVFEKMAPYFGSSFGNPHSSEHSIGWTAASELTKAAGQIARLVGADVDEIVFTSGATEANNLALLGLIHLARGTGRRRILVGAIEHKSVLAAARFLQREFNVVVDYVPVERTGMIDEGAFEGALSDDVLLVSFHAVNNEIGTIQNVERIGALARSVGAYFHCDAAQAPCATDVSSLAKHADLVSISSHKMYGPAGVGALVVARELQGMIEPMIHGGGQQKNLRSGTVPLALCVGMGAAAEFLQSSDADLERESVRACRDTFVSELSKFGWHAEFNGIEGAGRHPGNANLLFRGFEAASILIALQPHLAASSGSACTSGLPEPSHVLREIGCTAEEADSSVRFSFGRFTTKADAMEAAKLVNSVLVKLGAASVADQTL